MSIETVKNRLALLAYIPVIHAGYVRLLQKYCVLGTELLVLVHPDWPVKRGITKQEIRALSPGDVLRFVRANVYFQDILIFDGELPHITKYKLDTYDLVVINDEITRWVVQELGLKPSAIDSSFLRWDSQNVASLNPINYDCAVSENEFDRQMMAFANNEASKSPDWWRQLGAVLVQEGKILYRVHNTHVPNEYGPYFDGDPRDFVKAGTSSEIATSAHCELQIVTWAAKRGITLLGSSIYVGCFPCPMCANLIALSGIKKCYFSTGHAVLDGESIMKEMGVEIIWVKPN